MFWRMRWAGSRTPWAERAINAIPAPGPPARRAGLAILVALFVLSTTWPMRWYHNDARIDRGGAEFQARGLLHADEPWGAIRDRIGSGRLTLRLSVAPGRRHQNGPARIFSISRDHRHSNLTLGQQGRDLVLRLRRQADAPLGRPAFVIPGVFGDGAWHGIRISIEPQRLTVEIDDRPRLEATLPAAALSHWDPGYGLALGNEFTWDRPWRGRIRQAVIAGPSAAIDLLAPGRLVRADLFDLAGQRIRLLTNSVLDAVINLLGGVPLGILTMAWLPRRRTAAAVALWLPVCISVETIQIVTIGRYPCVSDLVLNLLGIAAGARLYLQSTAFRTG